MSDSNDSNEEKKVLKDIITSDQKNFLKKNDALGALVFKKNGEKVIFRFENELLKISDKQRKDFELLIEFLLSSLNNKDLFIQFLKNKRQKNNTNNTTVTSTKAKSKPKLKLIIGGKKANE